MKKGNRPAAYAQLYKAFCEKVNIPYSEWEWFIDRSEVFQFSKDEFFVAPHHLSTHAYFIVKGLVVGYREHRKEKFVHRILSTNDYVCSADRFRILFDKKNQFDGEIFIAAEETIVIRIKHSDMKWLEENSSAFNTRMEVYLKQQMEVFRELDDIILISPKDRYEKMQRVSLFGLERVPDVYLASYLCLTLGELEEIQER